LTALEKALEHSRKLKIDECEIVHVKRKITTVRITDSEIFELKKNMDENYGIRVIHNKKISSIQTSNENQINSSIEDAFQISSHLKPREFWRSLPHEAGSNQLEGVYDKKLDEISGSGITDIAQNMIDCTLDHKINTISGSINIVSEDFQIVNTNGLSATDKGTYVSGIINADSQISGTEVSGIGQGCCRTLEKFSPEQIGNDAKTMFV